MNEETPIQNPLSTATPESWFYAEGSKQSGPITVSQAAELISTGELRQNILVWKKGMPQWLPLSNTELASLLPADVPPPMPIAAPAANLVTPIPEEKVYPPKPLRSSAWVWWNLLFPGVAQVVYGQAEKGMLILLVSPFLVGLTAGFGILAIWPIAIIDAMKVHRVVSHRGWIGKWAWFPS